MDALKASGVRHVYERGGVRTEVLRDFSLTVGEGEFVALMGPSGSGKSTFLHLAAGLLVPASGSIAVAGSELTKMSDAAATKFRRRHEGVVFQSFNLLEQETVEENITLVARLDGSRVDHARVAELTQRLGLGGLSRRHPAELSGGEQQRVAIARALYSRPELILADEPTGNLDALNSKEVCGILRDLNAEERRAVLLVTHDPVVAASATRICFMRDGRIVSEMSSRRDPQAVAARYLEVCR